MYTGMVVELMFLDWVENEPFNDEWYWWFSKWWDIYFGNLDSLEE